MRKNVWILLPLLIIFLGLGRLVVPAQAATLTVCAVGCDFSSVATAVSSADPGDTIELAGEMFNENLVIFKSVTLQGENGTILDGGGSGRVISVTTGVNVSLFNLTVQNGSANDGGGIFNRGNLLLDEVTVTGNEAVPNANFGEGGGVYNLGTFTATDSSFSQNSAEYGGGLENSGGTINLTDVTISHNTATDIFDGVGGGLENSSGSVTLTRVTVQNNTANFVGGGIQNLAQMMVTDSLISGNVADLGGGLASGSSTGLTLQNSTVTGNGSSTSGVIRGGAGVYNTFVMNISNSTISGNDTAVPNGDGGGVLNNNLLTINSSTIFDNSASDQGGGVRNSSGQITFANTIVAQNGSGGDCSGSNILSSGYNLAGDASCAFSATGDQNSTNPQLGTLQDNGGATPTHALTESSPAYNAGNPTAVGSMPACPSVDQRGIVRPQGGRCDVGAFEFATGVVVVPPSASFTHNGPVTVGETAVFTNASTGDNLTFAWDFGDGETSTQINPTHVYDQAGEYTVTLTATNSAGSDEFGTTIEVMAAIVAPTAGFTHNGPVTVGEAALFTNNSTGDNLTFAWDFGDGGTSTQTNPSHVYTQTGNYTVTLTATNSVGSDEFSTTIEVLAVVVPPDASVTYNGPVLVGETAVFSNTSTGSNLTYLWDFGDGETSTEKNPGHVYTQAGSYAVTLTASNSAGSDQATAMIQVTETEPPSEDEFKVFIPLVLK